MTKTVWRVIVGDVPKMRTPRRYPAWAIAICLGAVNVGLILAGNWIFSGDGWLAYPLGIAGAAIELGGLVSLLWRRGTLSVLSFLFILAVDLAATGVVIIIAIGIAGGQGN